MKSLEIVCTCGRKKDDHAGLETHRFNPDDSRLNVEELATLSTSPPKQHRKDAP